MLKKLVLGALAIVVVAGGVAFLNKKAIILFVATQTGRTDVAPNRAIDWDQGPAVASETAAERPPNIIFILVDDLGINDLSTFGGGVAGGRVPTPNIDKLAPVRRLVRC